jgi:biopolymer transport protein ExbD
MNLPSPKKNNPATPPPRINRIVVPVNGQVTLNDQPMELPALRQALTELRAGDTNTSVVVRGAADVDYQKVIGVLDILQQVDITKVGLATVTAP